MYKPSFLKLTPNNLGFLAFLHLNLTGALRLFRLSEEMNGNADGVFHVLYKCSFFPSWPLFARIDGPFLSSPIGPIANSLLFSLLLLLVFANTSGTLKEGVTEDTPSSKAASPPASSAKHIFLLSVASIVLIGLLACSHLIVNWRCFSSINPLSHSFSLQVLKLLQIDPLQFHLNMCSNYQHFAPLLYYPLLVAILVPYGLYTVKILSETTFQTFTNAQKFIAPVLVSSIAAFSLRVDSSITHTPSESELATESPCNQNTFSETLTADDVAQYMTTDLREFVLSSQTSRPLLRRKMYLEHFSGAKDFSVARKIIISCLLEQSNLRKLSSKKLDEAILALLDNNELKDQVVSLLSSKEPSETYLSSLLKMLSSEDLETRRAAGMGLQKAELQGLKSLLGWQGKYGSLFLGDWYDFLDQFSIHDDESITLLISTLNKSSLDQQSTAARLIGGASPDLRQGAINALLSRTITQPAPNDAILHALIRLKDGIFGNEDLFLKALDRITTEQQVVLLRDVILQSSSENLAQGFVTQLLLRYSSLQEDPAKGSDCSLQSAFLAPKKVFIYGKSTPFDNFEVHLNILNRFGAGELETLLSHARHLQPVQRSRLLEFFWHTRLDISSYRSTFESLIYQENLLEIRALLAGILHKLSLLDEGMLYSLTAHPNFSTCMEAPLFAELLTRIGPSGAALLLKDLDASDSTTRGRVCERAEKLKDLPLLPASTVQNIFDKLRRTGPNEGCVFRGMLHLLARSAEGAPEGAIEYLGSLVEGEPFEECATTPWAYEVAFTLLDLRTEPNAIKYLLRAARQIMPGPFSILTREVGSYTDELSLQIRTELAIIHKESQQRSFRRTQAIDEKTKGSLCPNREGQWMVPKSNYRFLGIIRKGDLAKIRAHLKENPADINKPNSQCVTPLIEAIKAKQITVVDELLKLGADAEIPLPDEATPLMVAANFGSQEIIKTLLDAGASPNRESVYKETFLTRILSNTLYESDALVQLISLYKIDTNLGRDYFNELPPIITAYNKYGIDLVMKLHALGADLNLRDRGGNSLLHIAAKKDLSHYELLKRAGANPKIVNCSGKVAGQ